MGRIYVQLWSTVLSASTLAAYASCNNILTQRTVYHSSEYKQPNLSYDHVGKYLSCKKKGTYALKRLQSIMQEWPEPTKKNALRAALDAKNQEAAQFYASNNICLWSLYNEEIRYGACDRIQMLLPLMSLQSNTLPVEYYTRYTELPIRDVSGLAQVVESHAPLTIKKHLINTIIDFYCPKNSECSSGYFFNCQSLCNERRTAFLIYALAYAATRCIELKQSPYLASYLYQDCNALITQDAIRCAQQQGNVKLAYAFKQKRSKQASHIYFLLKFQSIQLREQKEPCDYYNQLALPVISGIKPGWSSWNPWAKLCSKE